MPPNISLLPHLFDGFGLFLGYRVVALLDYRAVGLLDYCVNLDLNARIGQHTAKRLGARRMHFFVQVALVRQERQQHLAVLHHAPWRADIFHQQLAQQLRGARAPAAARGIRHVRVSAQHQQGRNRFDVLANDRHR